MLIGPNDVTGRRASGLSTTTKNKQLNFLQHIKGLLKINELCAIIVPDNVLFERGPARTCPSLTSLPRRSPTTYRQPSISSQRSRGS